MGVAEFAPMIWQIERQLAKLYRGLPVRARARVEDLYVRLLSRGIGETPNPTVRTPELEATRFISVIVPVHNAPEETQRCLHSLERFAGNAEIIVVDDGSTDARARTVVAEFVARNRWKSRRNATGSGHSGACMSAVDLTTRPLLCLLNSDTVVTQHTWHACANALLTHPDLMAAGPMTSDGWTPQTDVRARRCRYLWSDAQIFWYAEWRYRRRAGRVPRPSRPYISGAALFLRRHDWDRVGGFSGCRPHYGNDVDLCRKLTENGGWIGVCEDAYVHHLGGRSR